jgi:hypothetical protein
MIHYPCASVLLDSPETLEQVAKKLSERLFCSIAFVADDSGTFEEVPALRLEKNFLGLDIVLHGFDGNYTLYLEPVRESWLFGSKYTDVSDYVAALIKPLGLEQVTVPETVDGMRYVHLSATGEELAGLHVIIAAATGITYVQQCAGLLNEEKKSEGFLVLVGDPAITKKLEDWFWNTFKGNCYRTGINQPWTPERQTQLRDLVAEIPIWHTGVDGTTATKHQLELDMERFDECVEAWVPVLTPYGKGVLVFKNSD